MAGTNKSSKKFKQKKETFSLAPLLSTQKGKAFDSSFSRGKRNSSSCAYMLMDGEKLYIDRMTDRFIFSRAINELKAAKDPRNNNSDYSFILFSILCSIGGAAEIFVLADLFFMFKKSKDSDLFMEAFNKCRRLELFDIGTLAEGAEFGSFEKKRALKFVLLTSKGVQAAAVLGLTKGRSDLIPRSFWDFSDAVLVAKLKSKISNAELIRRFLQTNTLSSFNRNIVFSKQEKGDWISNEMWLQFKDTQLLLINFRNTKNWEIQLKKALRFWKRYSGRRKLNILICTENFSMSKRAYVASGEVSLPKGSKLLFTDDVSIFLENTGSRNFIYTLSVNKNGSFTKHALTAVK